MKRVLPLILLGLSPLCAEGEEPKAAFLSEVELVALDVSVVDSNGNPVPDLRPSDFRLEVAGRPRKVVTAEFLRTTTEQIEEDTDVGTDATTNETIAWRRFVLFIVDAGSIPMGRGRDVFAAASAALARLPRTDQVGLLTIPSSGPQEEFTTDHVRIRLALDKLSGRAPRATSRFSFTLAEALACREMESSGGSVGMASERCQAALDREAGDDEQLRQDMWGYASEQQNASSNARAMLRSAFDALRAVQGEKLVLLVSQGLLFPDMGAVEGGGGGELDDLAAVATAAGAALYVVPADDRGTVVSAAGSLPLDVVEDDRRLRFYGLESLAVESRGAVLRGIPERALSRALTETAAHYRLGFEPESEDRTGKSRKMKIGVARPGVTVRGRKRVTFPLPATERERKDAITAALKSPTVATDLPVRAATWTLRDAEAGKVKLLLAAEIAGGARAAGLQVGYVLVDEKSKVVASATQAIPSDAKTAPGRSVPYSASLRLAPGTYTLRLAARDDRGRVGRVDHPLRASLEPAGSIELSDLLLGPPPAQGQPFRPAVWPEAQGGPLLAHGEIYAADPASLAGLSAALEITTASAETTVEQVPVRLTKSPTPGRMLAQAVFNGASLAPGRYVARLTVSTNGALRGVIRRRFVVPADVDETTAQ